MITDAKQLFQKQKELCAWWSGVVDDPRFNQVLLHAHCAFHAESMDQLKGATEYERVLSSLPTADETGENLLDHAAPGLHHNIDKED